jgi:uncharacterized membrane protein YccC
MSNAGRERLRRGWSDRLLGRLGETRDRLTASDPGLGRLRMALSAVVAMGSALGVEALAARLIGTDSKTTLVSMLLGAVVAMMGSNALVGPEVWGKVKNAAFFPVAVGVGMVLGTLTASSNDLRVAGFVVVMFVAVFVRRFGVAWFFYGFMGWMGFFFASFLQATPSMVPGLLVAVVVATVWVLLLSVTVFRTNSRKALRSTLRAFFARGRSVARECADLLDTNEAHPGRRARGLRSLSARQAGLAETALLAEAWSEDAHALPDGWSASALRRRLIEAQQAVDKMAACSVALAGKDPAMVTEARRVVTHLAQRHDRAARVAAERLSALSAAGEAAGVDGWWQARHLAFAARGFIDLDARADDPPAVDSSEEAFEATTQLVFGNLPGAPAVAGDVAARGSRWNPLTRLDMPTRQAVQVALAGLIAIVLGTQLSPTRYYWAVIAAFVTFTGTGTRSETFLKAFNRVVGTLVGLVASILLAHVTAGHTVAILATILGSVFLGFYLIRISYAYMIFFITIMLGQLYTALGTFSDSLLVLRLEETAVGALAGFLVALLIAPLSTRDTVRSARDELLVTLGELLEGVASYAEGDHVELDALSRSLDDRARRLLLVAKPLTRPLVLGNHSPRTRHRLGLFVAAVSQARALTLALQRGPLSDPVTTAEAARALAEAAVRITEAAPGRPAPSADEPLRRGDVALFKEPTGSRAADPVLRRLHHLDATLSELAETPAGAPGPGHSPGHSPGLSPGLSPGRPDASPR